MLFIKSTNDNNTNNTTMGPIKQLYILSQYYVIAQDDYQFNVQKLMAAIINDSVFIHLTTLWSSNNVNDYINQFISSSLSLTPSLVRPFILSFLPLKNECIIKYKSYLMYVQIRCIEEKKTTLINHDSILFMSIFFHCLLLYKSFLHCCCCLECRRFF